jgi:hypothetical protein
LLINIYNFGYINNLINDKFNRSLATGFAVTKLAGGFSKKVAYDSFYGKTNRWYEPSEGSMVFYNWYGGDHPSEIYSANAKNPSDMTASISRAYSVMNRPIIFKNAWNCFRIRDLSYRYPNSFFIWLRRDIISSVASDLESRYSRGSPYVWNSATTKNYEELFGLQPHEQSVEQQYWFNDSIGKNLNLYAKNRYCEVWYEDICNDVDGEVSRIEISVNKVWSNRLIRKDNIDVNCLKTSSLIEDKEVIDYVCKEKDRFRDFIKNEKFKS